MKAVISTKNNSGNALSEFSIIEKYFYPLLPEEDRESFRNEDAAVFSIQTGRQLVVTTDTLIAGVHFIPSESPQSIAKKALRANLSDLAAMGARAEAYTLSISLDTSISEDWIKDFCTSLAEDQQLYNIRLLGGDTTRNPGVLTISITAIGSISSRRSLYRSAARAGDRIYVTGHLGDATIGLDFLQGKKYVASDNDIERFKNSYRVPNPPILFAENLLEVAHAAVDISDGFAADLQHICKSSHLIAHVAANNIPLSKATKRLMSANDSQREAIFKKILTGGDDYQLIFTAAPVDHDHIDFLSKKHKIPITHIGHMGVPSDQNDDLVKILSDAGKIIALEEKGYEHTW
ncbi:MAG: thiamine-phosphate kinase [Alphaproteobacteria bacterium]